MQATLLGKNITSFNTLKNKIKQLLPEAARKISGENDLSKINIELELRSNNGSPNKKLQTASEVTAILKGGPQSVPLLVFVLSKKE